MTFRIVFEEHNKQQHVDDTRLHKVNGGNFESNTCIMCALLDVLLKMGRLL